MNITKRTSLPPGRRILVSRRLLLCGLIAIDLIFIAVAGSHAQTVVLLGAGSYASSVPGPCSATDSYFGLPAVQIAEYYQRLHLDPALKGRPIPTNHWWTDLLFANRSTLPPHANLWEIKQDPYGGNMWFYPGMLAPKSYGLDLHFPVSWKPGGADGGPQGGIDPGPALEIHGDMPYAVPADDVLIADFENGYPAGTTLTGDAFAAEPSVGEGLTGKLGKRCASTRDRGDGPMGVLKLPEFTVTKTYIHFLVCGGSSPDTQVRLIVNGSAVLAASGENSTTFRWVRWDVSAWKKQKAHLEVVDNARGAWGIIACDQIIHTDANNPIGRFGGDLVATKSVVTNWGDWNVDFSLPDSSGHKLDVTMARGIPFTWTRWTGMNPKIVLGADTKFYDGKGEALMPKNGSFVASSIAFTYKERAFGLFLPDNTVCAVSGSGRDACLTPALSGANNYMVVGYLPSIEKLAEFTAVAYARPTDTKLGWKWDKVKGIVNTTWDVTTTALKGSNLDTIQGWLPHHYRTTSNRLVFSPYTYLTPRGTLKCATGRSFQLGFPFKGIAPVLPAPKISGASHDYQPAVMAKLLNDFKPGTMIGDTYWAGKSLALCAQYMAWANQLGDTANFDRLRNALKAAFVNWLTYTPGETEALFCKYENWGGLIGWQASYGSQAFNDLHFHYGYFAVAAATLGMYDHQFLADYGPMLTAIVKCYGNYDRTDLSEPFLRTFDVWEGHSNAGGTSSPNGENQESSSEAMQSWGGMFLLGSMLEKGDMAAAGAMGFSMESCAVNEYWQDLYQTNFSPAYRRAGAGIVHSDAISYGTFFSGDPGWVYAIQYCPSNHWNNYLTRYRKDVVKAKYESMWDERAAWPDRYPAWSSAKPFRKGTWTQYRQQIFSATEDTLPGGAAPGTPGAPWNREADCSKREPQAQGIPGHVVLCYEALLDPDAAAAKFERYAAAGQEIATNPGDAGSTYYLIHSMRQIGEQDFTYTTSAGTSAIYYNAKTKRRACLVYNPEETGQKITVFHDGTPVTTFAVEPHAFVSHSLD